MRKRYLCGVVGIIIFIALGIFALVGVSKIVDDIVLDSVWMDPDKVESWGQNPGRSNTITIRNYTFFNMTNPHGYLYHNQTPKFNEINSFMLQ